MAVSYTVSLFTVVLLGATEVVLPTYFLQNCIHRTYSNRMYGIFNFEVCNFPVKVVNRSILNFVRFRKML